MLTASHSAWCVKSLTGYVMGPLHPQGENVECFYQPLSRGCTESRDQPGKYVIGLHVAELNFQVKINDMK